MLEPQRQLHGLRTRERIDIRLQQRKRAPRTLASRPRPPCPQHSLLASFEASRGRR
jgi:hypothetical protein